jgi:hypothetical protein
VGKRAVCAALAIASLSGRAIAQQSDAFDECERIQDVTARVACFDRAVTARHATRPAPAAANSRQIREQQAAQGKPPPPPPAAEVEVATIVKVIQRGPLLLAFELSNGQIWEQSESMKFAAEPQQSVTIRHGLLGSFFLKNAAGVSVRVHRLK